MNFNDMILTLEDTLMIVLDEMDGLDMTIMDEALEIAGVNPSTFEGAARWVKEPKPVVLAAALIRNALGTRPPTNNEADAIRSWFACAITPAD